MSQTKQVSPCSHHPKDLKLKKRKNSDRVVAVCENKITRDGKEVTCGEEIIAWENMKIAEESYARMLQAKENPEVNPDV